MNMGMLPKFTHASGIHQVSPNTANSSVAISLPLFPKAVHSSTHQVVHQIIRWRHAFEHTTDPRLLLFHWNVLIACAQCFLCVCNEVGQLLEPALMLTQLYRHFMIYLTKVSCSPCMLQPSTNTRKRSNLWKQGCSLEDIKLHLRLRGRCRNETFLAAQSPV